MDRIGCNSVSIHHQLSLHPALDFVHLLTSDFGGCVIVIVIVIGIVIGIVIVIVVSLERSCITNTLLIFC